MKKRVSSINYVIFGFTFLLFVLTLSCSRIVESRPYYFFCRVDTVKVPADNCIRVNWNVLSDHFGSINPESIQVKDLSNDKLIIPVIVDTNSDKNADFLVFSLEKTKDVPLKTFEISIVKSGSTKLILNNECNCKSYLFPNELIPVKSSDDAALNNKWPDTIANSIISCYPDPCVLEIYSKGQWSYTNGFFINALFELGEKTNNNKYHEYSNNWLGCFIDSSGNIDTSEYDFKKFELDNILPGRALIYFHQKTGDIKYKKAADQLIDQMEKQPMTSDSGFWHKKVYEHQMWLDGIYMADVFLAQYGHEYNKPQFIDRAIQQVMLIYSHTYDPKTGLLFHGWDESKSKIWADPVTGVSPEFWGRSIGWYMMALVDMLDYIPETHQNRNDILRILGSLSNTLVKYQDINGLWYQVIDKGGLPDNWAETSCSAMIAYAYAKGSKKGYLKPGYINYANKAFKGLKENYMFFDKEGKIYLTGTVKVGTLNTKYSDGSYAYYVSVERRQNDFKGLIALMYLSIYL